MNEIEKKNSNISVVKTQDGVTLCYLIRATYSPSKTEFFTPPNYSQQLGIIKYPKGGKIKPHYHNKVPREVLYTQEVLVIRKGKVMLNLFDNELNFVQSVILEKGDTVLLAAGGHSFEMIEDTEMLEIKQGPYSGVNEDKTIFE